MVLPLTDGRISALEARYRRINAYAARVGAALPNARDVGLAAHRRQQRSHDAVMQRASRMLRRIEGMLAGEG